MSISNRGRHEAKFYSRAGDRVQCSLCPHACSIADGKRGICGVRENMGGRLYSVIYGLASSIHADPIEKKPFYHFMPGTTAMSFSSVGCNLSCLHCQNYGISRAGPDGFRFTQITPDDVVAYTREAGAKSVSWTYNEPTIWHEFTSDASIAAHKADIKTNYVTNGFINEAPLRELKGIIDAMNIDVKAFTETFYEKVCRGRLAPVVRSCELAVELGMHVEVTYLVIPRHNDSDDEIGKFCKWVADSLGNDVPVHFSAFHPDFKLRDIPRTPVSRLLAAHSIARKAGLEFAYLGNVPAGEKDDTYCPVCGAKLIERNGFFVSEVNLTGNKCANCGARMNVVL